MTPVGGVYPTRFPVADIFDTTKYFSPQAFLVLILRAASKDRSFVIQGDSSGRHLFIRLIAFFRGQNKNVFDALKQKGLEIRKVVYTITSEGDNVELFHSLTESLVSKKQQPNIAVLERNTHVPPGEIILRIVYMRDNFENLPTKEIREFNPAHGTFLGGTIARLAKKGTHQTSFDR